MAWASRSGRARTSSSSPQAFAVCQRCGIWYNRIDLKNQMEWRANALLPTWIFVCERCYDTPNETNRVPILPADPMPVVLPFPEDFSVANSVMGLEPATVTDPQTGLPVRSQSLAMGTMDGVTMTPAPSGRPPGYDALDRSASTPNDVVTFMAETSGPYMAEVGGTYMATEQGGGAPSAPVPPLPDDANEIPVQYGKTLAIISLIADGSPLVRASCSEPHGLALNDQVMVRGAGNALADGAFSVIPLSATAFTYGCYSPVPAGSLLEQTTRVVTVLIGLPRDYPALPQTGLPGQIRPQKDVQ